MSGSEGSRYTRSQSAAATDDDREATEEGGAASVRAAALTHIAPTVEGSEVCVRAAAPDSSGQGPRRKKTTEEGGAASVRAAAPAHMVPATEGSSASCVRAAASDPSGQAPSGQGPRRKKTTLHNKRAALAQRLANNPFAALGDAQEDGSTADNDTDQLTSADETEPTSSIARKVDVMNTPTSSAAQPVRPSVALRRQKDPGAEQRALAGLTNWFMKRPTEALQPCNLAAAQQQQLQALQQAQIRPQVACEVSCTTATAAEVPALVNADDALEAELDRQDRTPVATITAQQQLHQAASGHLSVGSAPNAAALNAAWADMASVARECGYTVEIPQRAVQPVDALSTDQVRARRLEYLLDRELPRQQEPSQMVHIEEIQIEQEDKHAMYLATLADAQKWRAQQRAHGHRVPVQVQQQHLAAQLPAPAASAPTSIRQRQQVHTIALVPGGLSATGPQPTAQDVYMSQRAAQATTVTNPKPVQTDHGATSKSGWTAHQLQQIVELCEQSLHRRPITTPGVTKEQTLQQHTWQTAPQQELTATWGGDYEQQQLSQAPPASRQASTQQNYPDYTRASYESARQSDLVQSTVQWPSANDQERGASRSISNQHYAPAGPAKHTKTSDAAPTATYATNYASAEPATEYEAPVVASATETQKEMQNRRIKAQMLSWMEEHFKDVFDPPVEAPRSRQALPDAGADDYVREQRGAQRSRHRRQTARREEQNESRERSYSRGASREDSRRQSTAAGGHGDPGDQGSDDDHDKRARDSGRSDKSSPPVRRARFEDDARESSRSRRPSHRRRSPSAGGLDSTKSVSNHSTRSEGSEFARKDRLKMPMFDGTFFLPFQQQFEAAARANGYDEIDKQDRLRLALKGKALTVLVGTGAGQWTYRQLMGQLEARYGKTKSATAVKNALLKLRKKIGQTAHMFADEVDGVAAQAMLPREEVQHLAYHAFTNGLQSVPAQQRYVENYNDAATLRGAADIAAEWERTEGPDDEVTIRQNPNSSWALINTLQAGQPETPSPDTPAAAGYYGIFAEKLEALHKKEREQKVRTEKGPPTADELAAQLKKVNAEILHLHDSHQTLKGKVDKNVRSGGDEANAGNRPAEQPRAYSQQNMYNDSDRGRGGGRRNFNRGGSRGNFNGGDRGGFNGGGRGQMNGGGRGGQNGRGRGNYIGGSYQGQQDNFYQGPPQGPTPQQQYQQQQQQLQAANQNGPPSAPPPNYQPAAGQDVRGAASQA